MLALFFAGAFFAILILTLYYWRAVRPQLVTLSRVQGPAAPTVDPALREALQALNAGLMRHSALISRLPTSLEVRTPSPAEGGFSEALVALRSVQAQQMAALDQIGRSLATLNQAVTPQAGQIEFQQAALAELSAAVANLERSGEDFGATLSLHTHSLSSLDSHLQTAALTLEDVPQLRELVTALNASTLSLHAQLTAQSDRLKRLESGQNRDSDLLSLLRERVESSLPRRRKPAELEAVKGIGPAYARKLDEGGIRTLEQLTRLAPEQVREIIDVPRWRRVDAEGWIAQAQALVAARREERLP